jgi:hypothetical protein
MQQDARGLMELVKSLPLLWIFPTKSNVNDNVIEICHRKPHFKGNFNKFEFDFAMYYV